MARSQRLTEHGLRKRPDHQRRDPAVAACAESTVPLRSLDCGRGPVPPEFAQSRYRGLEESRKSVSGSQRSLDPLEGVEAIRKGGKSLFNPNFLKVTLSQDVDSDQ